MNGLQVFTYKDAQVRTVEQDGAPWFVLKDVCAALEIADHKSVPRRLDADEVGQIPLTDSLGREQEMTIINEPGLYNVILRSDKPEAKAFKRWVTHEVLPAIRQTGSYSIQQNRPMTALDLYEMNVKVLREHEQRMNSLEQSNEQTARKIESVAHILSTSIVPAEDWQEKTNDAINEIVEANGYNHQKYRRKLYDSLERSARCDLQARQTRFRNRMAKQGKTKTQQKEISKLFIIAQDCKLRKIFESILREEQAKVICVT